MKKFFLILFALLCFSETAFAKANVFCENMDTTDEKCVKISKKIYEIRANHFADMYVKMKKEKEGKIVDKKEALTIARRGQPVDKFKALFMSCGESSENRSKARMCLEKGLRDNARPSNKKKAVPKTK